YAWMATWAAALRSPADLGYPADGFVLPPLDIKTHTVETSGLAELGGVTGRAQMRASTVDVRVEKTAEIVLAEPDEPWIVWAGRNDEAEKVAEFIPGAVN